MLNFIHYLINLSEQFFYLLSWYSFDHCFIINPLQNDYRNLTVNV